MHVWELMHCLSVGTLYRFMHLTNRVVTHTYCIMGFKTANTVDSGLIRRIINLSLLSWPIDLGVVTSWQQS